MFRHFNLTEGVSFGILPSNKEYENIILPSNGSLNDSIVKENMQGQNSEVNK